MLPYQLLTLFKKGKVSLMGKIIARYLIGWRVPEASRTKLTAFGGTFLTTLPIFAIVTNSYTIKLPSGGLPEYVVYQDGKWTAASYQDGKWVDDRKKYRGIMYRARIDIVLIIDGKIVDLNRIPLPPDTPIIDKRFKEKHKKADAGDGK